MCAKANAKLYQAAEKLGAMYSFARQPNDLVMLPDSLSADLANPDYARVPTTSALATSGFTQDGLPWSRYIGPLPAGPAPPTGDWFTRLSGARH